MAGSDDICLLSATEQARRIRNRELSAREVTEAHLARIERVNSRVNAIVTLVAERAMQAAEEADAHLAAGHSIGPLHGLPVVHKDLFPTKGIRTTQGSPIFANAIPERDAIIVERLRAAGAITLGKSNTPEFGAGSQTFNQVFGATLNPYDLSKTCGGSSGGAAVALACRMVPLADGSDMGGSLRNPASFCNVVGLRPSPGRVPEWPAVLPWSPYSVKGPMARTAEDAALMLSAIAGPDRRAPLSVSEDGSSFTSSLDRDFRGVRVAWSPDLGGLPVDPAVMEVLERQRKLFEDLGCEVVDATPDLTGADEVFTVFRALGMESSLGPLLDQHRARMKETLIWNIEEGRKLTGPKIASAERARGELYDRFRTFMDDYEFLLCAVAQIPPFSVETEYPGEVNGVAMHTYIDWMRSAWYISATSHPAASVPAGFTSGGLPVGIQVVGRYRDEFGILQLAHAFQQANPAWETLPAAAG